MASFSHRYGFKSVKHSIQLESMDSELRNRLWNALDDMFGNVLGITTFPLSETDLWLRKLWDQVLKRPSTDASVQSFQSFFFRCEWFEAYDIIEFAGKTYPKEHSRKEFIRKCNVVLEEEVSAYRIVNQEVTRLTDANEIQSVENAINSAPNPVAIHLDQALQLLSDRKAPDYRNSIKESISAVEALCNRIVGKPNSTLGDALKTIEKSQRIQVHSALSSGFSKIYGWTSDANGIRHALQDEPSLAFEDALFMLISCSAFINYLIAKAAKAGIKL